MKIENDQYLLNGGIDPLELCEQYGCPLYVYDSAIIEKQYKRMYNAFDVKKLRINYACKALSNINILKLIKNMGAGLDTVSVSYTHLTLPTKA